MKNQIKSSLLLTTVVLLTACGLRYTPPESLEEIQTRRKLALDQQMTSQFATIGKKYTNLIFGESLTVKPLSYMRLDSLFEVKYQRSQQNLSTRDLEPLIEAQKVVLLADTTEILYMETNWFELATDSILEYAIARCYLNNQNVLRKLEFLDDFTTKPENQQWARKYMKEEWFTRDNGSIPTEDALFYTTMKNREFTLNDEQKEVFLNRTFEVMKIANELSNLSSKDICLRLAKIDAQKLFPNINWQEYGLEYQKLVGEVPAETSYRVKLINQTTSKEQHLFVYDNCYQLM